MAWHQNYLHGAGAFFPQRNENAFHNINFIFIAAHSNYHQHQHRQPHRSFGVRDHVLERSRRWRIQTAQIVELNG